MSVELVGVHPALRPVINAANPSGITDRASSGSRFGGGIITHGDTHSRARVRGHWNVECQGAALVTDPEKVAAILGKLGVGFDAPPTQLDYRATELIRFLRRKDREEVERSLYGGGKKWVEDWHNIVVNQGLDELLNQTLAAQTQITAWYVALFEANYTILSSTTAANFTANATESTAYSESTRQAWTANAVTSTQSVTNSSSKATFSINATKTIYGAALLSASAKSATSGKMYAGGQFASSRAVVSGDSLLVQATFTSADDGV